MEYVFDLSDAVDYNERQANAGKLGGEDVAKLAAAFQKLRDGLTVDGMIGQGGETLTAVENLVTSKTVPGGRGSRFDPTVDPDVWADWYQPIAPIMLGGELRPFLTSSGFTMYGAGADPDRVNHWGIDLMLKRFEGDYAALLEYLDADPALAAKLMCDKIVFDKRWFCPYGIELRAMGPGHVWSVHMGSNNNVLIDHHNVPGFGPLTTWYQHMDEVDVVDGQQVLAGQRIGTIGDGSSNLNHLHLEFRDHTRGGPREASVINPVPFLKVMKL